MELNLFDRIFHAITHFGTFRYPNTDTLRPKPWHPDGDLAYESIPKRKLPESDAYIQWLHKTGKLLLDDGSTKPTWDGCVSGIKINKAKPTDRVITITRHVGAHQLAVVTGYTAPYGGTFRWNRNMYVQGNPMQGYSDCKLHIYEDLPDGDVKITEIQNFRVIGDALMCDGVEQYLLSQPSTEARGSCAARLSLIGMEGRYDDIIRDKRKRRLSMSVCMARNTFIPPALASDGFVGGSRPGSVPDNPHAPPMGVVLRADPMARARLEKKGITRKTNPQTHALLDCYEGPGVMIIDTGGHNATALEPDHRWDQKDLKALSELSMLDFTAWSLD